MRKIKIFIAIGIGIIIFIGGWVILSNKTEQLLPQEEIGLPQETILQEVILVIDNGQGLPQVFEAEFRQGITAFDLLEEETKKLDLTLKTKTYDMGVFIEAIGHKENGQDGKYWMYYVNEVLPMVAADKYELKPGDKVEFKFETSPF